jgi:TatD DNase family protein
MLIDTHSHVYLSDFENDRDEMIVRAKEKGVSKILLPNIDLASINELNILCHPSNPMFKGMMGLHPGSVNKNYKKDLARIKEELFKGNYCAVGEIGIDLYWDRTFISEQIEAFKMQIDWAIELNLPIAIHARDSFSEIIKVLSLYKDTSLTGVFHCFSGSKEEMDKALSFNGFMLGIGGVLTFKNSGLDKIIDAAPLDRIVLETDAPYLAPVPFRGKRNEPSYIHIVAAKLAEIKGLSIEEIEEVTSANAIKLFNLDQNE